MSEPESDVTGSSENGTAALAAVARLFGTLLLAEIDEAQLRRLQDPAMREALESLGLEIPTFEPGDRESLEELAADYHAAFLRPDGGGAPPIGSLWIEGRYEGALAKRVRELAESAAVEFDGAVARDAPVDHLGCILMLWAATVERAPWVAEELARNHLAWASAPLTQVSDTAEGFYAGFARAVLALTREL